MIQIKKLILWLGIVIVAFIGIRLIVGFVTSGTLVVTTDDKSAIIDVSSAPTPLGKGSVTAKHGTGSLTASVPAGTYVVSVRDGISVTSSLVSISGLSSKTVNTHMPKLTTPEPVLYDRAEGVATDSGRMIYLANESTGIEYINDKNSATSIPGTQNSTSVKWADTQFGVAQDTTENLQIINGNTVHPLQSPAINHLGVIYAVTPNRTIYIGFGSTVYRGTDQGGFTQIYSHLEAGDDLVATNDKVMIIHPGQSSKDGGTAVILDTSGKKITKNFETKLSGWTPWSRNGKYIVVSVGRVPELFDSSLNLIDSLPQPTAYGADGSPHTGVIDSGAWLDDNTLFYQYNNQLWTYDLSQKTANTLATMPGSELIGGVSVSADGSYVYLTTSTSDGASNIVRRVGLRGQAISSQIVELDGILPIDASAYTLGLWNFSGKPTIVVYVTPGSDPDISLQSAKQNMQGIVSANDVNFELEGDQE
jgi:hypothetical protein